MRPGRNTTKACGRPLCPFGNDSSCASELNHTRQSMGFGASDGQAEGRDPIISPSFVVVLGSSPGARFNDETLFLHPLNRPVQRTGAHLQFAVGSRSNILNNGVAMSIL